MWNVEYTDTFGGEANYAWVRRATLPPLHGAGQRTVVRRAKAALGLTGLKGRTSVIGETYEFRPYGMCTVMFVTWRDA